MLRTAASLQRCFVSLRNRAQIAARTVRQWITDHVGAMGRVIFNVFSDKDRDIYEHLFK